MASKTTKPPKAAPRRPERKWGPFHGGVGVAVWLNETETAEGKRFFRSVTIAPRRYLDDKTGIPLLPGTKRSAVKWATYRARPPTEQEIRSWFGSASAIPPTIAQVLIWAREH
jgi:hypothetical protein